MSTNALDHYGEDDSCPLARAGARGTVFNAPTLVLSIDLTGVSAVGSSTRSKYVVSGPEMVQRKVAASQLVEITFPFAKGSMGGASDARTGVATFALNFNLNSGAVTSGTGSVSSPNYPR